MTAAEQCVAFFSQSLTTVIRCCLVDIPCLIMNAFTILCLSRIILEQAKSNDRSSNMFKYLLVKAMADFSLFASDVFNIRMATSKQMQTSLAGVIWNMYFYFYFQTSIYYVSSLMEIAAAFDCWISIKRKYKMLTSNITFCLIVVFSICFGFAFHVFELRTWVIASGKENVTIGNVTTEITFYYQAPGVGTRLNQVMYGVDAVLRDVLFLAVIIVLNILIFWELRLVTKRRISMNEVSTATGSLHTSPVSNHQVERAVKAQKSKAIMILFTGFNYLFGKST